MTGIFNRDYKNYFFKRGPGTGGVIGLSVSVVTPQKLFESFGEQALCSAIENFMIEKNLSLFGFVCNVIHMQDAQSEKNIMLYSHHKDSMANTLGELSDVIRRCDILRVKSE